MPRKTVFRLAAVSLCAILAVAPALSRAAEVNVYSARQENLIQPLLDRFTAETGITVNLVTGKAAQLLQRLKSEAGNTPADVLITTDAGNLHRAKIAGVLQAVQSKTLNERIPASYRDRDAQWFGLSLRARPIMYSIERVKPAELSTYEALADPKWTGRICIRSSNNIYNQSLVASMIAANGVAATEQWVRGLVANFARPPKGGDRDQIKSVAAGECDIAIANTYYLGGMLTGDDPVQREQARKVAVFWPNQDGRGVHVNVSGAGVTRAAQHRDEAVQLIEFMTDDASQAWYAEANSEYPVVPGIPWSKVLQGFGTFKADPLNLTVLGDNNAEAVRLMDRAGWK